MVPYRVESHVAPHVVGGDPIEHSGPGHGPQDLGSPVEKSAEQGHLGTHQVGKGDGRVNVAATNVTNGLDHGGSCQAEAQRHMQNVVGSGCPAQRGTHAEKHKEHGPEELCEDCPPKRHGPELPHAGCSLDAPCNRKCFSHKIKVVKVNLEKVNVYVLKVLLLVCTLKKCFNPFGGQFAGLTQTLSYLANQLEDKQLKKLTEESTRQI